MSKKLFIADTHFGHEKIIQLCNRPFENCEDMQKQMIEKWNNKVSDEDTVYILGDFCFKMSKQDAIKVLNNLKGKKVLIKGNHDRYAGQRDFDECFEGVYDYLQITEDKQQIILCHYPIWDWAGMYYGSIHLYGHIHDKTMSHDFNAYCVSAEHIDFAPATLEEIINAKVEK